MSLKESSYTFQGAANLEQGIQQINDFFKNNLGLYEQDGIYYFNEDHSGIGIFAAHKSNDTLGYLGISVADQNNEYTHFENITSSTVLERGFTVWYHLGKNMNSCYIRFEESSFIKVTEICAGKTESGKWGIIYNNTVLFGKDSFNMTLEAAVSAAAPFTMVKMPTPYSDDTFTSVYKILSAPIFNNANTLIYDGERIFRVVKINKAATSPCIAFEVSEDQ